MAPDVHIFTDASFHEKEGAFTIGCVVADAFTGMELAVCSARVACPPWWSSSLAERHGALIALEGASALAPTTAILHTDDHSIPECFAGRGRHHRNSAAQRHRALTWYIDRLRAATDQFGALSVIWVPRSENRRANALGNLDRKRHLDYTAPDPLSRRLPATVGRWVLRDALRVAPTVAWKVEQQFWVDPTSRKPRRPPTTHEDSTYDEFDVTGMLERYSG